MRTVPMPVDLTERDAAYILGGFSHSDYRTALAWMRGEVMRGVVAERLEKAAALLGFERADLKATGAKKRRAA